MKLVTSANHTVEVMAVAPMDNNIYLLTDHASGDSLLIDCANDSAGILDFVRTRRVTRIVTTHRHADHLGALAQVSAALQVPAYSGVDDLKAIQDATGVYQYPLADGEIFQVGKTPVHVTQLVGHTPGSIALTIYPDGHPPVIFTGDSLFPGGVGKTWSDADFTRLLDDVVTKIFAVLPDETIVLPGHGKATTIGAERGSIDQWRARGW
ncbi:MAG: MBL fold metallo-hydrolase [Bowdeniella nasicola]|nr:MBL fold metallo-hydrolase [Bowdeniella nasicola]